MVQNILKAIEKKANQEIKKILAEKENAILELEKESQKERERREKEERNFLQEKRKREIEEFRQKRELELKFHIQKEKQWVFRKVCEEAIERLYNLPENEFKEIVIGMVKKLPRDISGEILADEKTAGVLKEVLPKNIIQENLKEPGFIFKSLKLEIDFRFSEILKQKKQELEPELNKILFS